MYFIFTIGNESHKRIFFVFVSFRDGQLKRMKAKKEWKQKQQEEFSKRLKVE